MPNEFKAKNGVITPVLQVSTAGTVSAPSITKNDDLNTGIYFPSADVLGLVTNGVERLRVHSTGAVGLSGANYGTSGQVLTSSGSGSAPTWTTPAAGGMNTVRTQFTATSNQTTFSVSYTVGQIDVYLNGVKLLVGTEVTATSGTNIVLAVGATTGDIVETVVFSSTQQATNLTDLYTATNVGLGTVTPQARLDIASGNLLFSGTGQRITGDFSNATFANRLMFQTSTTNGNSSLGVLPNGSSTTANINLFGSSDPTNTSIAQVVNTGSTVTFSSSITGTGTYLPMTFNTGGSERVRVDTSGNVGIGTSSPVSKLVVSNGSEENIEFGTGNVSLNGGYIEYINRNSTNTRPDFNYYLGAGNGNHKFYTYGTERMRIDSSGNLLLGGTSNFLGARFISENASGNQIGLRYSGVATYYQSIDSSGNFTITKDGTERMRIDSAGNVGIGTSSPLRKLDISGGGFAFTESGGASRSIHWGDTTNIYPLLISGNATTGNCFITFHTNTFGNAGTERFRITATGAITSSDLADAVGYKGMPINSQSAAYTLVMADQAKAILHPSSDNNARTFTIPANSSVAFPVGTVITFINRVNTVTIAITTDTMVLASSGITGSRTLAANGIATAIKIDTTEWIISGNGLT